MVRISRKRTAKDTRSSLIRKWDDFPTNPDLRSEIANRRGIYFLSRYRRWRLRCWHAMELSSKASSGS